LNDLLNKIAPSCLLGYHQQPTTLLEEYLRKATKQQKIFVARRAKSVFITNGLTITYKMRSLSWMHSSEFQRIMLFCGFFFHFLLTPLRLGVGRTSWPQLAGRDESRKWTTPPASLSVI
jgi:hypothetical protein